MTDFLWRLEGVKVGGGLRPRLDGVSLDIPPGTTGILGVSGAGKTTLLNLLCGFSKPHGGRVEDGLPRNNCRLPLFWVPQNDGLWPHRTVRQHVAEVAGSADLSDRWLSAFDLLEHVGKTPEQLSHGERNRVAVARALASGAAVLIMDEPLAHVDPARIGNYWKVIRQYCRSTESSLIVATHSPEVAISEAQNAICLSEGKIVYAGSVEELYHSPRTAQDAALLGPFNWLEPDEFSHWLSIDAQEARCVRPEQLAVVPAPNGPIHVESERFAGSFAEVELRDERTNRTGRFFHRPAGARLPPGTRVILRLMVLLFACLFASACDEREQPPIKVKEIHYWSMPPKEARIPSPRSITIGPHDEVFVLDRGGRVLVFDESGKFLRHWDMPDSRIGNPEGACVFADGRIAVADTHYSRVVFFDSSGKVVQMLGSQGYGPGQFRYPVCVTQDPQGDFYVGEYGGNDRVQKFSVDGKFLLQIGEPGSGPGQFLRASGVAWRDGLLYVADAFNNRLQVFTDRGKFLRVFGAADGSLQFGYPYALALGPDRDLFVIEYSTARVSRFDLGSERLIGRFGAPGRGEGQFTTPWGIGVNSKGTILVADTDNRRIVELRR